MLSSTPLDRIDTIGERALRRKKSRGSSRFGHSVPRSFEPLPRLNEVSEEAKVALLIKKLRQCCIIYDYSDPAVEVEGKVIKESTLEEILNYFEKRQEIADPVYPEVVRMVSINIFRTLPPYESVEYDPEEDDPVFDTSWPSLNLVYSLFVNFLDVPSFDVTIGKKHINQKFMLQLLELFDSEDPREREYLKMILHRIYGKILCIRSYTRKQIGHIILRFVYETERYSGIAELLEVLGSIVNGFAVPLKEEHKSYLLKILIPLHKTKCLPSYYVHLNYCIVQYINKDPMLLEPVVRGLLKYWPKTCSRKELLFIGLVEEVLNAAEPCEFVKVQELLFKRLISCLSSPNNQVSERTLFLFKNEYIRTMIEENNHVLMPLTVPTLCLLSRDTRRPVFCALVYDILREFMLTNDSLFESITTSCHSEDVRDNLLGKKIPKVSDAADNSPKSAE